MDVKAIVRNVVANYDAFTFKFLESVRDVGNVTCSNTDLEKIILKRRTYACNLVIRHGDKINFSSVWPVMIGSKLDAAIRKWKFKTLTDLEKVDNLLDGDYPWETADIALTCFVINGAVKQIPHFVTNDPTNMHVINNSIVRMYRYNHEEKGTELKIFNEDNTIITVLKTHDGIEHVCPSVELLQEFMNCKYPVDMQAVTRCMNLNCFDIDHLGNKVVVSPGHLFYKLFRRTLFFPLLRIQDADANAIKDVKRKHRQLQKSIENGDLFHVLSKKTTYHKEATQQKDKMIASEKTGDKVFTEKKTTCYRDVHFQNYQLIPYFSNSVHIQISAKVKSSKPQCFRESYVGFLCLFGTTETKSVGKQMMLARDVWVSTEDDAGPIYDFLKLELDSSRKHFVVVNFACVSVSESYFANFDFFALKRKFTHVECFRVQNFIHVNVKSGILYHHLRDGIWVTPKDIGFWMEILGKWEGFPFITSYYIDLIPYFNHNAFPKNVLALNALKNAILSLTPEYCHFFRETVSAYQVQTNCHQILLPAADAFSEKWVIIIPKVKVMMKSFRGLTQEDCIVCRKNIFVCVKMYTLKLKIENRGKKYFRPGQNPSIQTDKSFLGTLVAVDSDLKTSPQTMHLQLESVSPRVTKIFCTKPDCEVVGYDCSPDFLFVIVKKRHVCENGDKLCSLHGQKGVMYVVDDLDSATNDGVNFVSPDMIVNPNCIISRQTMGQILEGMDSGEDFVMVCNAKGIRLKGTAMIGKVFYVLVNYLSFEHIYVADDCVRDKITGQPVKGRSRSGGMRAGNMENFNGLRGNGTSACFEEKLFEDSDIMITDDCVAIPKSAILCQEDAKFFKCVIETKTEPLVKEISSDEV